tara:strand:+ start:3479 stop:4798 length:1320 start_codon:yes stop_codon:yes gene_type:complete
MASVNPLLSPLAQGETMRDYKHASRTFVDNNFELQPRHGNLFHVVFEFTAEAQGLFNTVEKLEMPILVKSIDLPSYSIDVQTHNQYNRQVQTHHKISYNPVNVAFHDDVKELIRNLWHKYYAFYSADPTYSLDSNSYNTQDRYANRTQQQWGMQRGNKRFFKNIKIYSMHNHKFAEYTLINPIITSFNHDNHAYANGGLMQHSMTLAYETVKYATGFVNDVSPTGFGEIHYDVETSDLSNGNPFGQAFIDGQLVNTNGQRPADLFSSNLGTISSQGILFDNLSNLSFGSVISTALGKVASNLLTGQKPTSNILVPFIGKASIKDLDANDVTSIVVNNQTNFGTNDSVSSQGQSIGNPLFTNTVTSTQQTNVGYASTIPNTTGTVGVPNRISDVTTYIKQSTSANTRSASVNLAKQRLQDPNLSAELRQYYSEKIRLSNL